MAITTALTEGKSRILKLFPLAVFRFNLFLALLHILPILFDRHRHDFLVREHDVDTFKLHRDLGIVAEVRVNIAVDVLLLLKNGIVPGNEE